jgi:hypothetical protein
MRLELSAPLLSVLFNIRRVGGSKLELLQLWRMEEDERKKSYVGSSTNRGVGEGGEEGGRRT